MIKAITSAGCSTKKSLRAIDHYENYTTTMIALSSENSSSILLLVLSLLLWSFYT